MMRSSWENLRGVHTKPVPQGAIDGVAIYCPDTGVCYYVSGQEALSRTVTLRLKPPSNGRKDSRLASSYRNPLVLFGDS